jgi:DNA-binding NtrC family response regulator
MMTLDFHSVGFIGFPDWRSFMRKESQQNVQKGETVLAIRKVLIFDEDIEGLTQLAEPFEAQGLEVHKCMSVETARRCVEREEFDFALVDQVSPAFEGLRVISHLVRYNSRTPFVVVARSKDSLCYRHALALGAIDYLEKPIPMAEMDLFIQHYLGQSLKNRTKAARYYEL